LFVAVSCLLIALGAFYLAREQERIRSLYGDEPQTITLAQLAEKGYGDNVWVDLTEVEMIPKFVVQETKGSISAVWVAAVPMGQTDEAQEIKVILRSTRCKTDAEIPQKFEPRETYRGAVINPTLLWPHTPYRSLLQAELPNMKLAPTIWEVDIDSSKPSEKWARGFFTAGGVLAVIGALCGAAWCVLVVTRTADRGDEWERAEPQRGIRERSGA
jgi:hypothetical protein